MTVNSGPSPADRPVVHHAESDEISRIPRDGGGLPVSFAQQGLWVLDQLLPRIGVYNVPAMFEIRGRLDVALLRRCLAELLARHETLRTAFAGTPGGLRQIIAGPDEVPVPLRVHDLRDCSPRRRDELVRRLAFEQGRRPFDLREPPLWRASLLRTADRAHVLLLTLHHIVVDGWSMSVLIGEIARFYAALARGSHPRPTPLEVQCADYAAWERRQLSGARLEELLAYWRTALRDAPGTLALPTDRPRPAVASHEGDAVEFAVPAEVRRGVQRLAGSLRASTFIVLLAGFTALLHRHARQDDIVVGVPVANRLQPELDGVIGFFTNMLALRADLSGDPTFAELVGRIRAACLAALDHQELPFERLVAELMPDRAPSRAPLFQVQFSTMNWPPSRTILPGLRIRAITPVRNGTAKVDLSFLCFEEPDRLRVAAEYATDLFDRSTVRRMTERFANLLAVGTSAPHTRVSRLGTEDIDVADRADETVLTRKSATGTAASEPIRPIPRPVGPDEDSEGS